MGRKYSFGVREGVIFSCSDVIGGDVKDERWNETDVWDWGWSSSGYQATLLFWIWSRSSSHGSSVSFWDQLSGVRNDKKCGKTW